MNIQQEKEKLSLYIESIKRVLFTLNSISNCKIGTITPQQYDYHRTKSMYNSTTITHNSKLSWNKLLEIAGVKPNLDRSTLAKFGNSIHILTKIIIKNLGLGWEERRFFIKNKNNVGYKELRPDSCIMEKAYLTDNQLILIDVKLSVYSSPITIYKYLPIFEKYQPDNNPYRQETFFPKWIPNTAEPLCIDKTGQIDISLENNILYIAYLLGDKVKDILPNNKISNCLPKKYKYKKNKRILDNMEIRFIKYEELPTLYTTIAGIEYKEELEKKIAPLLKISEIIKQITLLADYDSKDIAANIYKTLKNNQELEADKLLDKINAI